MRLDAEAAERARDFAFTDVATILHGTRYESITLPDGRVVRSDRDERVVPEVSFAEVVTHAIDEWERTSSTHRWKATS